MAGMEYFRPVPMTDPCRPEGALPLAGGWCWFDRVEVLARGRAPRLIAAAALPADMRDRLSAPRAPLAGLAMDRPQVMAILNATPDSFSDGGRHFASATALAAAGAMLADIFDVGGESTRPGAPEVPEAEEIARTVPIVAGLAARGVPVSIDTRKAAVARAGIAAGAALVNDVTGLTHDPAMAGVVAGTGAALCIMHSRGTPETMAGLTDYDDLLLDIYDWLAAQVAVAVAAGIPRARIAVDPGIGFAKDTAQNAALVRRLSLFHGLGCPILLGVSRKRFIGAIGDEPDPLCRMPGSLAVALAGVAQGAQIVRVHDVNETRQALRLWQAVTGEDA